MKRMSIDGELLKKMFIQGTHTLYENQEIVDSLNVFPVPDGDTGTNMYLTMESATQEISKVKPINIETVSKAASNGSLMGARGNSGVILSQILRGFAKGCKDKEVLNIEDFAMALKAATDTAYKAVMKPIEGTILTVIREISNKAIELSNKNIDFDNFFCEIIRYGEITLEKTPEYLDVLKQAGVVDAGGKGLIFILKGFYDAINGKEGTERQLIKHETSKEKRIYDKIKFKYCTEFIIRGENLDPENFKKKIKGFGDSLLVVGDEKLIKVHIHTNNPGKVIEYGIGEGDLTKIKIDNMKEQHENKVFMEKEATSDKEDIEIKKYGFISVALGEGIHNIFKDLNVDRVINGGQTMNPSTEDIVKAINEVNAENIFIFPNNSNIILAANQAKEISDKNIIIIPTKSIAQGISSMLEFNPMISIEENIENMSKAIKRVKTIQITYSVRDSKFNEFTINKGDIIGIADGEILTVGNDIDSVAMDILQKTICEDNEILTMYYGKDVDEEKAYEFAEKVRENYQDIDVEVYYGGQPLYYYIFSIE